MSRVLSRPVLLAALALALLPGASPGQSGPPTLTLGKVTAKGGHRIRGSEDGVILNRRFGDDCLLIDALPAVKPVAASLGQEVNLEVEIISCRENPSFPAIQCRSWIENGPSSAWAQAQGARFLVPVPLPDSTGIHVLRLECRIGETHAGLATTLYLTYASPRPMVDPPDPVWYARACEWGKGFTGNAREQEVADRLLEGLFYFGQRNWRYGVCSIEGDTCVLGDTRVSTAGLRCNCTYQICKVDWTELVRAEGERNFSDCYQFSSAFEYIAATMGIGGMVEVEERGRCGFGFMTRPPVRSLDPAFAGNLLCGPRNLPCAFTFSNHDLRQRGGRVYDATFGGIYGSASELVFQNVVKEREGNTLTFERDAACSAGMGYGNYSRWHELAPAAGQSCAVPVGGKAGFGEVVQVQAISLDGSPEPEALAVDLEVVIEKEGSYSVHGAIFCQDDKTVVTLRPQRRLQDVLSEARISGRPGRSLARLIFSGEDLERSRSCAPFRLHANLVAEGEHLDRLDTEITVDPEVLASLSEGAASLGLASDLLLDWVTEGSGSALRATLPVTVRIPGAFAVDARLARDGETLAYGGYRLEMSQATDLLAVDFFSAAALPLA
ncbi:MAG TPA: hypothetical protein VF179_12715, partial [Thermoanaerobaculia bacterium]|nr:hypothetical protein [Thermoanaerobaculia bacterium]